MITAALIRDRITERGYEGGKTIVDEYVRGLRPRYAPPRTYQRTDYFPGELVQLDLWEPKREVLVGAGETRRCYVVVCALAYSRVGAGAVIFSKTAADILWGASRCLWQLGGLPGKVVSDREGALHAGGGRPTDEYAAWLGALGLGWYFCKPRDPEAKGVVERLIGYIETSFEPARAFRGREDFQEQLDEWFAARANVRRHQTLRRRPLDVLERDERARLGALPAEAPDLDWRRVTRVPAQPYVRVDTNDYSADPRFVTRRVEVRASQAQVTVVALDSGELVARHERCYRRHQTITAAEHRDQLAEQRRSNTGGAAVEVRPLERYDRLVA